MSYLRKNQGMLVGEMSAERIKKQIGTAMAPENGDGMTVTVRGRAIGDGVPNEVEITERMMAEALSDPVNEIVEAVRIALEAMPPELAADIVDRGIVLTGGGALLRNLDVVLREQARLPVMIAEDPLRCVANGCGFVLENISRMKNVLSPEV
jgi:rod shape-determining protein MreB